MTDFYTIGKNLTDKVEHHRYDRFYPTFLEPLRSQKFNMLEIGVDDGGSLKLWEEYFPHASIYGADINKEWQNKRCKVYKCDQSKTEDLKKMVKLLPSCKFIIDDGSHHPEHQLITFLEMFENTLEDGGIYIIEDVECNYWHPNSAVYGYTIGHFSMMDYLKKIADQVNSEFNNYNNGLKVSTITFAHNCVIITKKSEEEAIFTKRKYRYQSSLDGI